jgi:hypothetical protein
MVETCWICRKTGEEIESETTIIVVSMQKATIKTGVDIHVCPVCMKIINYLSKQKAQQVFNNNVFDIKEE